MKRLLRSFGAFLKVGIAVMLQYRGEIVLWSIWGIVNPAVLYALWGAAVEGQVGHVIAGFGPRQFAAYFFVMMVVGHLTAAWDAYEMGYHVRSGTMSALLLQPILPIWQSLATNLSYKITTLIFVVPMWLLAALWMRPAFEASHWHYTLGALSLLLGAALTFFAGYLVALVAFWSTKLDAVGEAFFTIGMVFGGRMAPLEALPGPLKLAADAMPFRWMFAFPTEMLIGRTPSVREALVGLVIQASWLVAVLLAFRWLWFVAVRRYTAVSG